MAADPEPTWPFLVPSGMEAVPEAGPTPTFSVVIPAYQSARSVGETVGSVLTQTAQPLEVIVADDGSTDDIAAALAPHASRIRLVRNEHRGPGAARNSALAHARGEFVAFLDADDVFEPRRLEALGDLASRYPELDILATDVELERGGRATARFYTETFTFPTEDQAREIVRRCFLFAPAVRRSQLTAVGGFDESPALVPAEDWDCWIRLIRAGAPVGLVASPLVRYRLHGTSLTSNRANSLRARGTVLEKVLGDPSLTPTERTEATALLREARHRALTESVDAAIRNRDPDARRRASELLVAAGTGARARAKAALTVASPSVARALLNLRSRR